MKVDTLVTLSNGEKFVLLDETTQNDNKYFLATLVDENGNYTTESTIFIENISDGDSYLKKVEDPEVFKYILSVFTTTLAQED